MARIVAIFIGLLAASCVKMPPYGGHELAHPTMTTEPIEIGREARVHAVTEGAIEPLRNTTSVSGK